MVFKGGQYADTVVELFESHPSGTFQVPLIWSIGQSTEPLTATLGLIDYGMGNLHSVNKAFQRLIALKSVSTPDDLTAVRPILLELAPLTLPWSVLKKQALFHS